MRTAVKAPVILACVVLAGGAGFVSWQWVDLVALAARTGQMVQFAMFENNRRQVFDVIRGRIEQRVEANISTA